MRLCGRCVPVARAGVHRQAANRSLILAIARIQFTTPPSACRMRMHMGFGRYKAMHMWFQGTSHSLDSTLSPHIMQNHQRGALR